MSETITNGGQPQCGSVNSTATVRCKGVAGHGGSHSSPARFNGHTVELQWMDRDAQEPATRMLLIDEGGPEPSKVKRREPSPALPQHPFSEDILQPNFCEYCGDHKAKHQ